LFNDDWSFNWSVDDLFNEDWSVDWSFNDLLNEDWSVNWDWSLDDFFDVDWVLDWDVDWDWNWSVNWDVEDTFNWDLNWDWDVNWSLDWNWSWDLLSDFDWLFNDTWAVGAQFSESSLPDFEFLDLLLDGCQQGLVLLDEDLDLWFEGGDVATELGQFTLLGSVESLEFTETSRNDVSGEEEWVGTSGGNSSNKAGGNWSTDDCM
jgi:hypothetical protein